jgi:Fe-S-cluster containining protein
MAYRDWGSEMSAPACLTCGACCFSRLETYVRVTGDDHERLGDRTDELVRFEGNRAYMRMVDGHCAALLVEEISGQLFCSAYETRPETCRDLARDSGACLGEIESKHERPLIALAAAKSGCIVALPHRST